MVIENGGAAAWERLVAAIPDRLPGGQGVVARDAGANLGYAGGVNAAIEDAGPDGAPAPHAYWVLNPDTLPDRDALERMVAALDANTGAEIWKVKPAGPLRGSPTLAFGAVYVMTQDNQIYALDASDGSPLWQESGAQAQAGVFGVAAPAAGQGRGRLQHRRTRRLPL